jgi:ABC-type multidrug transport system permease subunit
MQDGSFDLLLNIETESPYGWLFYSAETTQPRVLQQRALVAGLERAALATYLLSESGEDVEAFVTLGVQVAAMSVGTPHRLFHYYPRATDRITNLFTRVFALILCLLPFALTAPAWIRERECHTLETLLAAPRIGAGSLVAGKVLFALVVTLFEFLLMLVLAESFHSLGAKTGMTQITLFLLPALLASALLGIALSTLANSQSHVAWAVALYVLGSTLFGGFFYPIEQAGPVVSVLSNAFPLTFVHPAMTRWMLGAGAATVLSPASAALWCQALALGLATWIAVLRALRRL